MTNEQRKTRAQYLNSLAVAVLTLGVSAVVSGTTPMWVLVPVVVASLALHTTAVRIVR